jgi:hypothetical protein
MEDGRKEREEKQGWNNDKSSSSHGEREGQDFNISGAPPSSQLPSSLILKKLIVYVYTSSEMLIELYTLADISRILGIKRGRLSYWLVKEFIKPSAKSKGMAGHPGSHVVTFI